LYLSEKWFFEGKNNKVLVSWGKILLTERTKGYSFVEGRVAPRLCFFRKKVRNLHVVDINEAQGY